MVGSTFIQWIGDACLHTLLCLIELYRGPDLIHAQWYVLYYRSHTGCTRDGIFMAYNVMPKVTPADHILEKETTE